MYDEILSAMSKEIEVIENDVQLEAEAAQRTPMREV